MGLAVAVIGEPVRFFPTRFDELLVWKTNARRVPHQRRGGEDNLLSKQ